MTGFKIDVKNKYSKTMDGIRLTVIYLALLVLFGVYFFEFHISAGQMKLLLLLLIAVPAGYYMVSVSKHRIARIIVFFVVTAFVLIINNSIITKGLEPFVNSYIRMEQQLAENAQIIKTEVSIECFIVLLIVQIILSSIFTVVLRTKSAGVIPALIMLIPIFVLSGTGHLPSILSTFEILASIIVFEICYHMNNSRETIISIISSIVVLIILIGITLLCMPSVNEYKETNIVKYKEIRESLRDIDKLDIKNIISKKIEDRGNYTKGGIGKGDLRNLTNCRPEGTKELEVIVSEKPDSRIYLKAFVGTTYTGQKWEKLGKDAKGKLSRFAENRNKQMQLLNEPFRKIQAAEDANNRSPEDIFFLYTNIYTNDMEIHLLNELDDIGYFPYYANITDMEGVNLDSYIDGNGRKDYLYEFYPQSKVDTMRASYMDSGWDDQISDEAKQCLEAKTDIWKRYSEFVSEIYTAYPDKLMGLSAYCDELKELPENEMYQWMTDIEVLSHKIDYEFMNTLTYTLTPGEKPGEQDFVEYFLIESRKGFCVHFASSATLIYRKFGFPARYVEGYSIPTDAFKEQEDGTYKAVVTDDMAHAWCETFDEIFGWQVREHTKYFSYNDSFSSGDFKESTQQETTTKEDMTVQQAVQETTTKEEMTTVSGAEETKAETIDSERGVKVKEDKGSLWLSILRCAVFLLILIILSIVQCSIRINNKMLKFRKREKNKGILCMYNEIYELCLFCGFKPEGKTESEIIVQMSKRFFQLDADEWQWIYDCVIRAAFSGREANRSERKEMYRLLSKFKKQVWESLSLRKKIIFKLVKAM